MSFSAILLALTRLAVWLTTLQVATVCGQLTVSSNENTTVFLGGDFNRICRHNGATLEWIRNETVIQRSPSTTATSLHLSLVSIGFSDAGQYLCRARLSGGETEGPVNAGYLSVLDPDRRIVAPPIQYAFEGNNAILNCTTDFPNALFRWFRGGVVNNDAEVGGIISNITIGDEGTYTCRVFLSDVGLSHTTRVELRVIIPPVIVSHPLPYTIIMGTPTNFNLTVQFRSRFRENTTVTWHRNNSLLPEEQVHTRYTSEIEGITIVNFPTISRSDSGLYQVTIKNALKVIPTTAMTTVGVYQLHVVIPPTLPSNVIVSNITGFQVQVTWSLTHQHADERAESLILTVLFSNGTIAQQYQLEGSVTQQVVDTVPGMEYQVTMSVFNQDGTNTTDPVSFQIPPGRPNISSVEVTRLNMTTFNLSVSLAYTGGGAITHFRILFLNNGTTLWSFLGEIPATPSPHSNLLWSVVVSRNEFATHSQVVFILSVTNQHGFVSNPIQAVVRLGNGGSISSPLSPTGAATEIPDQSPQNAVAVVAAVVGAVVGSAVTVLLLAMIVVLIIIAIVKSKKKKDAYGVGRPGIMRLLTMKPV